jgi:CheY-like chemotaxis protein/HPt (histidine-containing phosphotransfer) domain-containing protein/anti-sigma regulatory factor (Ser/Thr protein kinase)
VLTNLVSNAVKFTERGEVVIKAELERQSDHDAVIRFSVRDTGTGIPPEEIKNLFQPFSQVDPSNTKKFDGTGLGLAVSKHLVELMGGQISVESELGKGSLFWFTARLGKQDIQKQDLAGGLGGALVLIVDDNPTSVKILRDQAASWGLRCGEASNGEEALIVLRRQAQAGDPYKIALIDLEMPGMNGLVLARTLKADALLAKTEVVLLTSLGLSLKAEVMRGAGAAAYLRKPIKQVDLYNCLVSLLASTPADQLKPALLKTRTESTATGVGSKENPLAGPEKEKESLPILIVEDNEFNQRVLSAQLKKLGYRSDIASNGLKALDALETMHYDLIFIDCQMPEMDGYKATAEIRRREGNSKHTVIIAMTARVLEGAREECLAAGMDDYLSKPVTLENLSATLDRWLTRPGNGAPPEAKQPQGETPDKVNEDPVNLESFHEVTKSNAEFHDFIKDYLTRTAQKLNSLERAIQDKSAVDVKSLAHGLAGSTGVFGITRLAKALRQLEYSAEKEMPADAEDVFKKILSEFERAKRFLETLP